MGDIPKGRRAVAFAPASSGVIVQGECRPAQHEGERQHGDHADDPDPCIGGAPAVLRDEVLEDGRPDGAGEIVAGCRDGDGGAATALEPVRYVGHQRREERGGAEEANEQAMH